VAGFPLRFLGIITFVEGDLAGAKRYLLESLSAQAEWSHHQRVLSTANLGYVVRAQGDGKLARDYLLSALRLGAERRSIGPVMNCLPLAALLAADDNHTERAVEIYGLAQEFGYITNSRWFDEVACRELDKVLASLPPEIASLAEARGRELDIWDTANDLLEEYTTIVSD